jgi:arylsulfatase
LLGAAPTRPNLILILADHLGYSELGCYGGKVRTPNIFRHVTRR